MVSSHEAFHNRSSQSTKDLICSCTLVFLGVGVTCIRAFLRLISLWCCRVRGFLRSRNHLSCISCFSLGCLLALGRGGLFRLCAGTLSLSLFASNRFLLPTLRFFSYVAVSGKSPLPRKVQ